MSGCCKGTRSTVPYPPGCQDNICQTASWWKPFIRFLVSGRLVCGEWIEMKSDPFEELVFFKNLACFSPFLLLFSFPWPSVVDAVVVPLAPSRYECQRCGRSYNLYGNLRRHWRYDCGEQPPQFACPRCGRLFRRRSNLRAHAVRSNCHPLTPVNIWREQSAVSILN